MKMSSMSSEVRLPTQLSTIPPLLTASPTTTLKPPSQLETSAEPFLSKFNNSMRNSTAKTALGFQMENVSGILSDFDFNVTVHSDSILADSAGFYFTGSQWLSNNISSVNTTYFNSSLVEFSVDNSQFSVDGVHKSYDWIFLFVIFFIFAGGLGNILVCLAVSLDRRLQNVTNYFLLSLAIADLLVSLIVMPLGAIPVFLGYWPLGFTWCNIYVTCDVLACSSSILHMCFISLGRYLGIRNPIGSRHHSTKRIAGIKIAIVWAMAMIVSSSITVLGFANEKNIMPDPNTCVINHRPFLVFGSLVTFYIPMLMMFTTYALTIPLLRKKARFAVGHPESELFRRHPNQHSAFRANVSPTKLGLLKNGSKETSGSVDVSSHETNTSLHNYFSKTPQQKKPDAGKRGKEKSILREISKSPKQKSYGFNRITTPSLNLRFLNNRNKRNYLSANAVATEQKATKVLGLVFFTFVLCWSPFFIYNIIFVACPECYIPEHVVRTCLWLGYVSSTINPIIYTIFNRLFRAEFIRLLKCNCERSGRTLRYCSVNGHSPFILCASSALPLAISFHGAPLMSPAIVNTTTCSSGGSSGLNNMKTKQNSATE